MFASTVSAKEFVFHAKSGERSSLQQLLQPKGNQPLLVMIWATHCKPCMSEGRIMAAVAKRFRKHLRFVGIQASEGVNLTRANARKYYKKLKEKLKGYGVKKSSQMPEPYLGDDSEVIWDEITRGTRFSEKATSIPLFALYDADGNLTKVWTRSVYEDRHAIHAFIAQLESTIRNAPNVE
jgi:thiol-disulfide isomerase/thioredoxin